MKLKKGDSVKVVIGKDKGMVAKIDKVYAKKGLVVVAGVNQYKRHLKARRSGQRSEIITITKPLAIQNVSILCPSCKKETRVGYEIRDKKKVRICKKCKSKI